MPCSPMDPLSSTLSPGRARSAERSTPSGTSPIPVVLMNSPSPLPLLDHFRVAGDHLDARRAAACCSEFTTRREVVHRETLLR